MLLASLIMISSMRTSETLSSSMAENMAWRMGSSCVTEASFSSWVSPTQKLFRSRIEDPPLLVYLLAIRHIRAAENFPRAFTIKRAGKFALNFL
jgi:hypothetical protein